jgi:hypothetical protein
LLRGWNLRYIKSVMFTGWIGTVDCALDADTIAC